MTDQTFPVQRQRAHRSGYMDSQQGGIVGVDSSVALPVLPNTSLRDVSSSFLLQDVFLDPKNNNRITLRQNDGVRVVDLLRTDRVISLSKVNLPMQAFTSLEAVGDQAIGAGGGNRGTATASAWELGKSGLGPVQLPTPTVTVGNPGIVDFGGAHGLETGDLVRIVGNGSTPTLDGVHPFTKTTDTRGTLPVNVTVAASDGLWLRDGTVDNEGNLVAYATTAGQANATVYESLMRVRPDDRFELDLVHVIAAATQDCSVVLATDAAGANEVEIARSMNGTAVFQRRRLLVHGRMLDASAASIGVFVLLKAVSGGTANASHALVTGRKLSKTYEPIRSFHAACSSAGTNALGYAVLHEVPAGTKFEISHIHLDDGDLSSLSIGVADSAVGAQFVPILTSDGTPVSKEHGALVTADTASRFIVAAGWKTTAGAGEGTAAIDGRYWA